MSSFPVINPKVFAEAQPAPPKNPHGIVVLGGDRYDTWKNKQIIKNISVDLKTDIGSEAHITLFDPRFKILDKYADSSGVSQLLVKVYLGFGEDLGEPVFKGLLDKIERGSSDTTFIVHDMGIKMKQEGKGEYHKGTSLDIIQKLATRNGLKFEGPEKVDPPLEHHPSMIQDSKNDWKLAAERAREVGFNIYVRQDTLFCKEPAKLGQPIFILRYRKDFYLLHDFSLSYKLPENQRGRAKLVEYRGRHRGGKRLTGLSRQHPRGHKPVEMRHDLSEHTQKHATRRAHAKKELEREPAWNCSIRSVPPLPQLRPDVRNTIRLENVGNLFSADYLVDNVRHELSGNDFFTDYTLYRDVD
jgi:hypothetical protein